MRPLQAFTGVANPQRLAMVLLALVVSFLALNACLGGEAETLHVFALQPSISLVGDDESRPDLVAPFYAVDSNGTTTLEFFVEVRLLSCSREVILESDPLRATHGGCEADETQLEQEDIETLTATGRVRLIPAIDRIPVVNFADTVVFDVGPLSFGERQRLGPFSFAVPAGELDDEYDTHKFWARVVDCTLSNGTPCGNNANNFGVNVVSPVIATAEAGTGSQSQGLTASEQTQQAGQGGSLSPTVTPVRTPSQASAPGVTTIGRITHLQPNSNRIVIDSAGSVMQLDTDSSGNITGTFMFEWWFESSPARKFPMSGSLTATRRINLLSGEFQLDDPGTNFLAIQLGGNEGVGTWGGTINGQTSVGDWIVGSFQTMDRGALRFELGVE